MVIKPRQLLVSLSAALVAVLGVAGPSGLLIPNAVAGVARRPDDDSDNDAPLLIRPSDDKSSYLAHRSHSSHRSHQSHYSGSGGGGGGAGGGGGGAPSPVPTNTAPAVEPRAASTPTALPTATSIRPSPSAGPANVSFIAYPGGRIFVDGQFVGNDVTWTLTLAAGEHEVRVKNRFLGEVVRTVRVYEAQSGIIAIEW